MAHICFALLVASIETQGSRQSSSATTSRLGIQHTLNPNLRIEIKFCGGRSWRMIRERYK